MSHPVSDPIPTSTVPVPLPEPVSIEEVRTVRFPGTRFRPGYDEEAVDAFLNRVVATLGMLGQGEEANETTVDRLRPRSAAEHVQSVSGTAAGVLALAQEVADRTKIEATAQAEEDLAHAAVILAEANAGAEVSRQDAERHAASLVADAQQSAAAAEYRGKREATRLVTTAKAEAHKITTTARAEALGITTAAKAEVEQLNAVIAELAGKEHAARSDLETVLRAHLSDITDKPFAAAAGTDTAARH